MIIQTNQNIITEILVEKSGYDLIRSRWLINYKLIQRPLIGNAILSAIDRVCVLENLPERPILDEQGNQTGTSPATTDLTDFVASFTTVAELVIQSDAKALGHSGVTEWDPSVIDNVQNAPGASDVRPWESVIGQLVAPPNRLEYLGVWYDVKVPHTVQSQFPPPIATLYSVGVEQPGGAKPDWAVGTYELGAEVQHNGQEWINRRANNNQGFAPGTDGSGWMQTSNTPAPWYNLGNEGYPSGWTVTQDGNTYLNTQDNNFWNPNTGVGWVIQ